MSQSSNQCGPAAGNSVFARLGFARGQVVPHFLQGRRRGVPRIAARVAAGGKVPGCAENCENSRVRPTDSPMEVAKN